MKTRNSLSQFNNIGAWIEHWADLHPEKVAFTFLEEDPLALHSITYAELLQRSQAIAAALLTTAQPGDRVILTYQPGLEFIVAFLGCVQAGLIAVPVYPPTSPKDWPRFVKIVINSDAQHICTTQNLAQLSQAGIAMTPPLAGLNVIATDTLDHDKNEYLCCGATQDTVAFLQYTSGSTGNPKGVMLTHGNLYHNECLIKEALQIDVDSVAVCWLPQYHDMGLIGNILGVLFNGISSTLMSPITYLKQPYRWLKAISDYRATISGGPNFAYELCTKKIADEKLAELDLSSWAIAYNGAEPIRMSTLDKFSKKFAPCGFNRQAFTPLYGLAESSLLVTHHPYNTPIVTLKADLDSLSKGKATPAADHSSGKILVSSGEVIDQTLRIVNPDTLSLCADNEVGEIWIQGASVSSGYWKNPEATEATFNAFIDSSKEGPFLRTGDLGFLQGESLFITGRLKEMMIVDGRNLYPQDIEETIQAISPIFRVGCGAVFSNDDEAVFAVQELSDHTELSPDEITHLVQTALRNVNEQHQLALEAVILIEQGSLLKTSSGKIRRTAMAQLHSQSKLKTISEHSPKDFLQLHNACNQPDSGSSPSHSYSHYETIILEAIAEALGINPESLNPQASFSDFGLDSKTLVGLTGTIEERLGRSIPTNLFFDYPSISKLAKYLNDDIREVITENAKPSLKGDVAIIGIGCRFPGHANSPEEFWQLLVEGQDAIVETPSSRWDNKEYYDPDILAPGKMSTRWGGYLHREKDFDAAFFGIKDNEATLLDPQQRILLETSWHAFEHAGIPPESTAGGNVGVFVGISNVDYDRHCSKLGACTDPYAGTGNATSIAANRLSYFYDWRGPSVAVDTACSSSLVALHQACQSLKNGECELAITAAVNLILSPELSITFSKSGMMAADGRCKAFDDSADGYVRSEGCGVLILKNLEKAQQDRDNIIAVVKGSAITQDGRSNGITAPNGPAQIKTIRDALQRASLTANDIQYVESHGTGTALGDPVELHALAQAYGQKRHENLMIGSVKTNIGHLESASGIAGVIKTALCIQQKLLPRNLHLDTPNRQFDWQSNSIEVVNNNTPWQLSDGDKRRAGVSSFGFGGTNAHVILEEPPRLGQGEHPSIQNNANTLFCLSAKDRSALQTNIRQYQKFLSNTDMDFNTLVASQNCSRTHFDERLVIKCDSVAGLREDLNSINWAKPKSSIFSSRRRTSTQRAKIIWMFTGQGSQHLGMGHELYHTQHAFRDAIEQCHAILLTLSDINLKSFILDKDNQQNSKLIDRTDYTQPILFCYEYALAQILVRAGIQPDSLIGHSLGEIVAATIAGVFSLEDGIRIACIRGSLMQELPTKGGMMAVFAHKEDVVALLDPYPLVSIGALNGHGQVVLSGCEQSLDGLALLFEERDIETRKLKVSHGFHSPLMEPILDDFRNVLKTIQLNPPKYNVVSNVTAASAGMEMTTIDYWCKHVVATVNFQGGLQNVAGEKQAIFIEVGPKPTLSAIAKRGLGRDSVRIIPLVQDPDHEQESLLDAIAQCYTSGININWANLMDAANSPKADLPLYPFQRKYYWLTGTLSKACEPTSHSNNNAVHPLLGQQQHSPYLKNGELHFITYPGLETNSWAGTFKQSNTIHYHLNHFLEMAIEIGHEALQTRKLHILDLELHQRMSTVQGQQQSIHTIAERRASNELRIQFYTQPQPDDLNSDQWVLLCSASISSKFNSRLQTLTEINTSAPAANQASDMASFFDANRRARTQYCSNDRNVVTATQLLDNSLLCEVDFSGLQSSRSTRLWIKPEAIQGLYQIIGFFCESLRSNEEIRPGVEFTPYCVRSIVWNEPLPERGHVFMRHVSSWSEEAEHTEMDLFVFDEAGHMTMRIDGIQLKSRIRSRLTLAEKVRSVGMEERINIIASIIADSLAANLGGQAMDIDMSSSLAELGVDSITVISTLSRLKNELSIDIPVGEIHKARSVENFTTLLAAKLGDAELVKSAATAMRGTCAVLREGLPGVLPLFFIHAGDDGALQYLDMANAFGDDIPFYVMLPNLTSEDQQPAQLEHVIQQLVSDIQEEQPHGPYMLAGWSLGATLSILVANHLAQQGEEVRFVSLIDAPRICGTNFSQEELQRCINKITQNLATMNSDQLAQYRIQLRLLYEQTLHIAVPTASYELKHFQSECVQSNAIPMATAQDWASASSRRMHSQTIPGDHISLFKSGNVETLASFLRRQIRSSGTISNRFLCDSIERGGLAHSVLAGKPELNESNHPTATLKLDEDHPYFFDHELDHIPGILIMAGAWELICRSTLEFDPFNPILSRSVGQCSLLFDRFAEKDTPLQYELICTDGNTHSIKLECHIIQAQQRIGTYAMQLDYARSKPVMALPTSRQILSSGLEILHKQLESNVLIQLPVHSETRWECQPQMPEPGHYLYHTTLGYGCLNPIYVLEATRQFLTYLSHDQFGVEIGTHVNLIDIALTFNDTIDFNQDVRMILTPQPGLVEKDAFQTISVLWVQAGRTVVVSQITAQITHDETYQNQRSR
ncbi:MAG: AMP-binding protein [Ketobacter sp.]|nr:AMP-binding protein [Ketobacter sp.]